jgi:two-component system OmpR family sensor kinase
VRHPVTLRRRLVLSVVALLALVAVVIGAVSVIVLRRALIDGVDQELRGASQRSVALSPPTSPVDPPRGDDRRSPFINVGTISMFAYGSQVFNSYYFDGDGTARFLTAAQTTTLLSVPSDGRPRTVDLGGLGDYRASLQTDDSGVVRVTALPLGQVHEIVLRLIVAIGIITLVGILLAALAAAWTVRRVLRPLDRVAATAQQVSGLRLDRGEVALAVRVPEEDADPRTEVGKVGSAINAMLGHVGSALASRQESEQKVRQFVADASHELRTPLASIRGYAELTRRSEHDLPPDVVHSIGRVESEAKRMTSLVEDLLLLARLDAGRDLEHASVDLSRLLIDAVGDAHAAGPDHEWSLDLPDEPVVVPGDGLRLHQVVANLLANARTHTPAGTSVTVGLEVTGEEGTGVALLTVADTGPGIPAASQATLFERFARGDSSRSRIAGSTGLGLAIVRAVVTGHGGRVWVDSVPGRTVFSVQLPRS